MAGGVRGWCMAGMAADLPSDGSLPKKMMEAPNEHSAILADPLPHPADPTFNHLTKSRHLTKPTSSPLQANWIIASRSVD